MKKVLVLMLAILLVGMVGMAKTEIFSENVLIEGDAEVEGTLTLAGVDVVGDFDIIGNLTQNGTLASLDGSATVDLISAGHVDIEAPDIRFGYDGDVYMKVAIATGTGDVTITQTGSNKAMSWTAAAGFTWGGEFSMGTNKITGAGDPTAAQDVATKAYVDATAQGLKVHAAVGNATTANVSLTAEQTIDGVLTSTSRILVKDQSAAAENGIYVTAGGAWARASDMDSATEVAGSFVFVTDGTSLGCTGWTCTIEPEDFIIGTTAMPWSQFSDAGYITASDGLAKTGNNVAPTGNLQDLHTVGPVNDNSYFLVGTGVGALAWETTTTVRTSLGLSIGSDVQAWDAELDDLAGLTFADDYMIIGTGAGTIDTISCTTFAQTILDDTDAAGVLGTLDTGLADLATVTMGSNLFYYTSADNVHQTASVTAYARDFLNDSSEGVFHATVNLETGTDVQAWDAQLDDIAALVQSNSYVIVGDDTNWVQETGGTLRTSLGLAIDSDVQAHSVDLDTIAAAATTATNEGVLFVSQFTIAYTQTDSYTVCIVPANADVTKVEVVTTTAFTGGSATTIDVGYVGTLEAYAGDLDIRTAGFADCDVFSNLGDVGGTDVTMKAQIATDDSAGACTVYIYWTMGTPGTP